MMGKHISLFDDILCMAPTFSCHYSYRKLGPGQHLALSMGLRPDPDPTKRIRQLRGEGSLGAEGRGRQDHAGGLRETDGGSF